MRDKETLYCTQSISFTMADSKRLLIFPKIYHLPISPLMMFTIVGNLVFTLSMYTFSRLIRFICIRMLRQQRKGSWWCMFFAVWFHRAPHSRECRCNSVFMWWMSGQNKNYTLIRFINYLVHGLKRFRSVKYLTPSVVIPTWSVIGTWFQWIARNMWSF